jgi:hypothetical protein
MQFCIHSDLTGKYGVVMVICAILKILLFLNISKLWIINHNYVKTNTIFLLLCAWCVPIFRCFSLLLTFFYCRWLLLLPSSYPVCLTLLNLFIKPLYVNWKDNNIEYYSVSGHSVVILTCCFTFVTRNCSFN